jgi:hypothetical protein
MRRPSSRKDRLFDRNEHLCYKIGSIYFDIIWESVDNIEAAGILSDCEHAVFALNIMSRFCDHIMSRQSQNATW